MTDRNPLIESFLKQQKWDGADRKALPFDLSYRRYQRLAPCRKRGKGNPTVDGRAAKTPGRPALY